jgi:hypothetical protein
MANKSLYRSRVVQIAVYAPKPLLARLKREGTKRRRKVGPTVLEILLEYFAAQDARKEEASVAPLQPVA